MNPQLTRFLVATLLGACGLASAQTNPRFYTMLPNQDVFTLPETQRGVARFTLTNLTDSFLTVSGTNARADFIRGSDRLDDFRIQVLGEAISYEVEPHGTANVPVVITPDLIGGDPVEDLPGIWNLVVRPRVHLGSLRDAPLPALPIVNGLVRAMRVVITDVPVPEAETWALGASGLGLVMLVLRRRPRQTAYF